MNEDDKLKIKNERTSATVQPLEQAEYIKPVIQIVEKRKDHESRANTHMFERPISESQGGGFGFSQEEVKELNEHLSWLRSKYYEDLKP